MTYFKGIFFTTLMFFAHTAFGSYSPTNDFVESDINVSFEPQVFPEAGLNENYTPVLLFNDCLIPFNEQIRSKLNTQEIRKQNSLDEAFSFKQMTNVKPCQAEIAQLVLDSLDKQANQLALVPAVVGVPIYLGACLLAEYMSNKRAKVTGIAPTANVHVMEAYARMSVGTLCFPVYGVGTAIRWGINDGHDPLFDDERRNRGW